MSTETLGPQSVINFGKHKGHTFIYVYQNDAKYVNWLKTVPDPSGNMLEFLKFIREFEMCNDPDREMKVLDTKQTRLDAFLGDKSQNSQDPFTPRSGPLESSFFPKTNTSKPLNVDSDKKRRKLSDTPTPEDVSFVKDKDYKAEKERLSPSLREMLDALTRDAGSTRHAEDSSSDGFIKLEGTLAFVLFSEREFYLTYTKSAFAAWWTNHLPGEVNRFLSRLTLKTNLREIGREKVVTYNAEYYTTILKSLRSVIREKNTIEPIPNFVLRTFPEFAAFSRDVSLCEATRRILFRVKDEYTTANRSRMKTLIGDALWDKLLPFQRQGVEFGLEKNGRVLIGDEMGLGKTLQALAIAAFYQGDWPLLIVCPSSLRIQWKEQCLAWLPHLVKEHEILMVMTSKPQHKGRKRKAEPVDSSDVTLESPFRSERSSPRSFKTTPQTSNKSPLVSSEYSSPVRPAKRTLFESDKTDSVKSEKNLFDSDESSPLKSSKSTPYIKIDEDARVASTPSNRLFSPSNFNSSSYTNTSPSNLLFSPPNFKPRGQNPSKTPSNYSTSPMNLMISPINSNCTSNSNFSPLNMNVTPKMNSLFMTFANGEGEEGEGAMANPYKIVITSYDLMVRIKDLTGFNIVICDESHYLKNQHTQRTKRIVPELKEARRVLMLSGTPALNLPLELFQQLDSIIPGFSSFSVFVERYCKKRKNPFKKGTDYADAKHTSELHLFLINTVMIRRLKKDVMTELPPKFRSKIPIEITEKMARTTRMMLGQNPPKIDMSDDVDVENMEEDLGMPKLEKTKRGMLQNLFMMTGKDKVKGVCKYVEDILESDDKFIIFAHHLFMLDAIEETIAKSKAKYIRIDGSVKAEQRAKLIQQFQESKVSPANTAANIINKMFNVKPAHGANSDEEDEHMNVRVALLSISCCGVGLNLSSCSNVIFAELYWVPGVLLQAEDRVHRIGTKSRSISINYLIAQNSVDELIWKLINKKYQTLTSTLNGAITSISLATNKRKAVY